MEYRKLGRTELKVSSIGFGALPLPALSQDDAAKVLNKALDVGINFIDTARGYRESEELIGNAISHRRKEYFLATKTRARREKDIKSELETSLKLLKTDHIDLYQMHYVNTNEELDDILQSHGALNIFQKLKEKGIIGYIGITGHDASVLLKAAKTGLFDTIQGAFSYIEKGDTIRETIDYCHQNNIAFIVQKPLAGGAIRPASAGLKWILQHPISTVIPGMISIEQVVENTNIADTDHSLSSEEKKTLDELSKRLDKFFCRRCYYCHSVCPEGIQIGVILEFYGKAQYPENLEIMRRFYSGRKVKADACTKCGLCENECPYDLPIMDLLEKAHALLG